MNEQNYETNYEEVENTVEFEPMVVAEPDSGHGDLLIGIGIGAAAVVAIEKAIIPGAKWAYHKIKSLKKPKSKEDEVFDQKVIDVKDIKN